jgi:hypothetical protein
MPGIPTDDTNLVCKAALLLRKSYQVEGKGVSIRLKKKFLSAPDLEVAAVMPPEFLWD